MITASTLTNGTLTLVLDGGSEILTARNDHPKWTDIVEAFKAGNEAVLRSLISLKAVVESYSIGKLSINSTGVTHNGHPLTGIDSDRVLAFLRDGLPYRPIANYMERKLKNPSARAIKELYNFLEHRNMPLTPEGFIIAYKGVQSSFYSVMGNTETVVLQGTVDSGGHILNTVGETIEIERSSCDDDFRQGCSFGLHAGSLAYAKGWGQRVLLVEIDPADVVSVPEDCNCQKLRCCKYRVIGEYTGPLPDTYTSEFGTRGTDDTSDDGDNDSCDCNMASCSVCSPDTGWETPDDALAAKGQAVNQDGAVVSACPQCQAFDCICPTDSDNTNGGDDNESDYLEGMQAGVRDLQQGDSRYLPGDEQGADSPAHESYIRGYLNGYFGSQAN